jgi:hypothetical protein
LALLLPLNLIDSSKNDLADRLATFGRPEVVAAGRPKVERKRISWRPLSPNILRRGRGAWRRCRRAPRATAVVRAPPDRRGRRNRHPRRTPAGRAGAGGCGGAQRSRLNPTTVQFDSADLFITTEASHVHDRPDLTADLTSRRRRIRTRPVSSRPVVSNRVSKRPC